MAVTHVGADREIDGFWSEFLGRRGSSNTSRVLETRVLGDRRGLFRWAPWILRSDVTSELGTVFRVQPCFTLCPALTDACASIGISQALELSATQGILFDEDALTLVALPCPAKASDNGAETGVFRCAPSQGSIPALNEHKVGEVCARHAQWAPAFESEPAPTQELVTALGTLRVADDLEYHNVCRLVGRFPLWHGVRSLLAPP